MVLDAALKSSGYDEQAQAQIMAALAKAEDELTAKTAAAKAVGLHLDPATVEACASISSTVGLSELAELAQKLWELSQRLPLKPRSDSPGNLINLLLTEAKGTSALLPVIIWALVKVEQQNDEDVAQRCLSLYAPLADRLGLAQVKNAIEDLAFKKLQPQAHQQVDELLAKAGTQTESDLKQIKQHLARELKGAGIKNWELTGRRKHLYSVHQKLAKKGDINAVYDIIALRVLVPTTEDCYKVLNILHEQWQPLPNRFKDYIVKPKSNGYRSLHTTLKASDGKLVEVQVRTPAMHDQAEFGLAAHWQYNQSKSSKDYQKGLSQLAKVSGKHIYAFSPQGDVFALPPEATALDFAFQIHSSIGLRAMGAKVNGKMAKLDSAINNGDTVELLTQKNAKPKKDWLRFIKTAKARNRIRAWLRVADRDQYIRIGQSMIKAAFMTFGHRPEIDLAAAAAKIGYHSLDDLYIAVGSGILNAQRVVTAATSKK